MKEEIKPEVKKSNNELIGFEYKVWKEQAAFLIQKYFKRKYKRKQISLVDNKLLENPIMRKGKIVGGKGTIISIYYVEESKQMRIGIYEKENKYQQDIILDNVNYSEQIQNMFAKNIWKIIEKIKYDKISKKFRIDLNEEEFGRRASVLVIDKLSIPQIKTEPETKAKKQLTKIPQNITKTNINEIYRGLKKVENYYYNVTVTITKEFICMILIQNENLKSANERTITIDMSKYIDTETPDKSTLELSRIVYNAILSDENGILNFNEKNFNLELMISKFENRQNKISMIKKRFKEYIASLKDNVIKVYKANKSLNASFGIKIGKKYHFIKIFRKPDDPNTVIIKSNKAVNVLKIGLNKLGLEEEDFKSSIKKYVAKILSFDPKKNILQFLNRKNVKNYN